MLNNKFRARQFGPGPMDYMKHKIERIRNDLLTIEQQPAPIPTPSMVDEQSDREPSQFTSSEEIEDYADDEFSSEAGASDLLSIPDTPLLPLHKSDVFKNDALSSSSSSRLYLFLKQPISILLLATAVFIPSSSALAILDRFQMYQATYKFPFPLTHLFCQLLFCEVILLLWTFLSSQVVQYHPQWKGRLGLIENITWDLPTAKSLAHVSLSFLIAGAAFTSCLEYVSMESALLFLSPMILIQLALSKFLLPESTQSIYIAMTCIALMFGHALAAISQASPNVPNYNIQGLVAALISAVAVPVYHCLVRKHLPRLNYHSMQLLHYILSTAVILTIPLLIISGEIFEIASNCFFLDEGAFWLTMLLLCTVGTLCCISQFMLLTITSPLTLVVLTFAKTAIIQVPISKLLNKSSFSMMNVLGLTTCLVSTGVYLYLINSHRPRFGLKWQT